MHDQVDHKKRIKIIQCLVYYLPNRIGGIEVYVHSLNKSLLKKGFEIKVLVPDYPEEKKYPQEYDGIPIITYTEYLNTTKGEFQGITPGKGLPAFKEMLANEKPDIVHFHQLTSSNGISLFHLKAAKELGIKVIYTNHLVGLTCLTSTMIYRDKDVCDGLMDVVKCAVCDLKKHNISEPVSKMAVRAGRMVSAIIPSLKKVHARPMQLLLYSNFIIEKRRKVETLLGLADRFIVIADWFYKVLQRNGFNMENTRLISQGLPFSDNNITTVNRIRGVNEPLRVVFVGRVYPDKGLHILLKAIAELPSQQFTVDIYGQVTDQDYFEMCRKLYDKKEHVTYHGHINSSAIVNELHKYDVLVLPSMIAEMAPLVIREAFAAGIPVIGSDIGGISEVIQDGYNGFLYEMGDFTELRSILTSLINDHELLTKLKSHIAPPRTFNIVSDEIETEYLAVLQS
jgi:glycosyltransferase involved in cell wall biosynthesis